MIPLYGIHLIFRVKSRCTFRETETDFLTSQSHQYFHNSVNFLHTESNLTTNHDRIVEINNKYIPLRPCYVQFLVFLSLFSQL